MAYKSVMEGDALQLFFRPNPDDTYGIAPATAIGSPQRDEALGVLGFFIGHEIARGRPANPCDPSLLLLFLSGLQFDSLTKAIVQEWHPQLCNILTGFLEAGPQGDVSPFQIPLVQYLNPIMLQGRDQAGHQRLAAQLLYNALIRSEPLGHREFRAFLKGFRLPCWNGFNLVKAVDGFGGGASMLLSLIWSQAVISYQDAQEHIRFRTFPTARRMGIEEAGIDPQEAFVEYLKGQGVPNQDQFQAAQAAGLIPPTLTLAHINTPGFRCQLLFRAATGNDFMKEGWSVSLVMMTTLTQTPSMSTDFSPLLTNDVHITITSPSSSGIGDRVRSTGDGITVEVWNMAYKSVMEGDALQLFFRPNPDDTYGIAPATAIGSPQRDEALGVLGFFIGYEIALGRPANPCDPSLLLLFLSGLQFDSLTKAVIQEWHPQLCNILTGFLEAGPQGDVSPFQIPLVQYLNPIMLQGRDQAGHQRLAAQLLYNALIRSEPLGHREFRAFLKGFRLPCWNGFNLAVDGFGGGASMLLSLIWSQAVISYQDAQEHIHFRTFPTVRRMRIEEAGIDPQEAFVEYLKGQGVPNQDQFQAAQAAGLIPPTLTLAHINTPGFRCQFLFRAATGNDFVKEGWAVNVRFVGDDDHSYTDTIHVNERQALLSEKKIRWQTCAHNATVPVSIFKSLKAEATADGVSFQWKVDSWLFMEMLTSIGQHGIL
ncbi:hypothetical protein OF83DRAFT_1178954 [Amylostereum chailletii]|nr:hypothetical protein OF83DRAFT_1178954 [Amylostereum chailletii]